MAKPAPRYLKQVTTGRIYIRTEIQAMKPEMLECTKNGNLVFDGEAPDPTERGGPDIPYWSMTRPDLVVYAKEFMGFVPPETAKRHEIIKVVGAEIKRRQSQLATMSVRADAEAAKAEAEEAEEEESPEPSDSDDASNADLKLTF